MTRQTSRPAVQLALALALALSTAASVLGQVPLRARDLGIPFDGEPGPLNAITDVAGVEVGHVTLIEGEGPLVVGQGPVRTGVTAILPRGKAAGDTVFAGWYSLNGNGEMTGTIWIEQSGILEGPVLITNTHSVGVVRDAVIAWMMDNRPNFLWALPVVAETFDGGLNDINGFHVRAEHAITALDEARGGPVPEGNVGGGTGMVCHQFKGGIGTASRLLADSLGGYTVGVLVQCNYGARRELSIAGVPIGRELIDELRSCFVGGARTPVCGDSISDAATSAEGVGSIIVVVATDALLLPHQLKRVAARVALAIGRVGGKGENSSGDIFVAFSTANRIVGETEDIVSVDMLPNEGIDPIYYATVQATEEAIINALVAARTMEGANGRRVYAMPHDRVREILRAYNRLVE